ncbi:MAG: acetyl-CoA carboxylase carboxyltransferase subunit alpha, partial [Abyssibius alkaniclasticus]
AEALRLTAQDLNRLGIADKVIPEPVGGAQRDRKAAIAAVGKTLEQMLKEVLKIDASKRRMERRKKFIALGNKTLAA